MLRRKEHAHFHNVFQNMTFNEQISHILSINNQSLIPELKDSLQEILWNYDIEDIYKKECFK